MARVKAWVTIVLLTATVLASFATGAAVSRAL